MGTTVFGVKIILQDKSSPVAENTTIGLYNVAGSNSEFRWLQNSISGLTTWKEGMIVEKGLKNFSLSIELIKKGNISYPGRGEIVIKNTAKFWQTVQALGINFQGLKLEIYLFNGISPWRVRTYECEEPTFDSREYRIPFKGMQEGRVANIMNVVTSQQFPEASNDTIGKVLPATFGKLYPKLDSDGNLLRRSMAKFIRVLDKQTDVTNAYFTGTDPTVKLFPVNDYGIGSTTVLMDFDVSGTVNRTALEYPQHMYAIVVDGSNSVGEIRKVIRFSLSLGGTDVHCLLDAPFSADLLFSADSTRAWVKLIDLSRTNMSDHWQQNAFLDENGVSLVNDAQLYINDSTHGLTQAPQYAVDVTSIPPDKNKLTVDGKALNTSIDTLASFLILPVTSLELETAATLANWNHGAQQDFDLCQRRADGVYNSYPYTVNLSITISGAAISNAASAYDRDLDTYAEFSPIFDSVGLESEMFYKVLRFTPPAIPKNISVENIYIGIKAEINGIGSNNPDYYGNSPFFLIGRRFSHTRDADRFLASKVLDNDVANALNDLPDFYVGRTGINNRFFKANAADGDAKWSNIYGYTNFNLSLTREQYEAIQEFGLFNNFLRLSLSGPGTHTTIKIHELAVIVKVSDIALQEDQFSPAAGRNFVYTWQGRKTAADLIERPADLIEHACRLQNYRDTCYPPPSGWGLQYADAPLIGTSGHGSFDDPDLAAVRAYCAAAQLTDRDDGFTDKVKQAACRDFAIANWQDQDGMERILALPRTKLAPVYTVTLDDVLDRNRISVLQKKQADIFSEPLVRFQKNPATGDYDKLLAVKNASHTLYLPSYVEGVENAGEAEALWRTAHSLALKSHQANEPPTDLTDLVFADGPGGYTVAYNYLKNWLDWQLATDEIEFPVHVNTAASWQECTPINVLFSHQTNNVSRSALVESSVVTPNPPYEVMIKAIMYA